jgi:hypothetical protein
VLLAYVDESYTDTHYWIAAVVCPETEVQALTDGLDAVVAKAAAGYHDVSSRAELHGHSLFHGKDDWLPLAVMPRARIGVYADALDAIAERNVDIFIRGVDRKRLVERYVYPDHPHSVVLMHLLERLDEYAAGEQELVLVIADEVDRADEYRRNLWGFQRASTTGYRSRQLTRILDTIHFAPSNASRLVQAADLVAYLHCRIHSGAERDKRAKRANDALWERLAGRLNHVHCWYP